jgi:PPOX class probable F420-dependent enzyme
MEPAQPTTSATVLARAHITSAIRALLDRPIVATLASIDEDGRPRQAVIWYRLDGDDRILVNSLAGRRWPTNLLRDGRASLAVTDPDDPYAWIGIDATVNQVVDDVEVARDDIVALAHRYHDNQPEAGMIRRFRSQQRLSFRLAIDAVHDHLED